MTQPRPDEESQIVIYPERFPERELDRQLKEELHNASELDPVLDSWYIQDSDDSTVELEGDSESSEEEEECFRCRGLFEDKTYPSVSEALRSVAASHNFYFEKELNEAKLDIYGRVASVNLLRKLVYGEGLAFEDTVERWRDYIQQLRQGTIQLDTSLLQSYFRDDPLLHFAANYFVEDEWID